MKLFTKKLLPLLLLCSLVLALSACKNGGKNNEDDHSHTFSAEWSGDGQAHWHAATCSHTEEVTDYADHTFDEFGVCVVCGYHTHVFAPEWSFDAEGHWHRAACAHVEEKGSLSAHDYGDDDICDVCGYDRAPVIPPVDVTVTFAVEGAEAPAAQTVSSSLTVAEPPAPNLPGCTFLGWFLPGSETPYTFSSPAGRESFTLTAHFSKDYTYTESDEGITLTAYVGKSAVVYLPKTLYGKTVLSFGQIFAGSSITAITFGDGVTEIADRAFANCELLVNVTFASDLYRIGERSFENCASLGHIHLPKSVVYIGKNCFDGCDNCRIFPEVSEAGPGWSRTWFPDNDRVYYNFEGSILPYVKFGD